MDVEKSLVLIFLNQGGNQVKMSVSDVKDGIMSSEVKTAMESIIAKNIFDSDGGDLISVAGAQVITKTTEELLMK